jgi:RimJ/RimL family protein N-acetyltransferase
MHAMLLPQEIKGARVRLRKPVPADADAIFEAYAQDPVVCRFLVWPPHTKVDTTREFLAAAIEAWQGDARRPYAITAGDADAAIGMIEARIEAGTVDMGYVLARTYWGKGLVPDAILALARTALALPEIFRVQAFCDAENIRSQRALEKAGLKQEGRLHRWAVHPNISPEPRDCFMYALAK